MRMAIGLSAISISAVALLALLQLGNPEMLSAQTPASAAATAAPKGDAANGKKLFTSYGCYQCHGYMAQGSAGTGARLAPKPIPFAAFSKYIRNPTGDMPPYTAKVVTEQELADVYAFLSGIPNPPPIDSIPLLKQ
jgi:ubiquinol-cytochrome c reductase cytochrome c subunit